MLELIPPHSIALNLQPYDSPHPKPHLPIGLKPVDDCDFEIFKIFSFDIAHPTAPFVPNAFFLSCRVHYQL